MISSILIKNIYNFVNRIGVVYEEQIVRMFSKTHGYDTVLWCLKELVDKNQIDVVLNTSEKYYKRRQYVKETDFGQKLLTESAWILATMGEQSVRDYWTTDYPSQLLIITEDNTVYDVTIFTFQTMKSISLTVNSKRRQLIPDGVEDEIVHIAVLPDRKMAEEIGPLNFDTFCILDQNHSPKYYQWED